MARMSALAATAPAGHDFSPASIAPPSEPVCPITPTPVAEPPPQRAAPHAIPSNSAVSDEPTGEMNDVGEGARRIPDATEPGHAQAIGMGPMHGGMASTSRGLASADMEAEALQPEESSAAAELLPVASTCPA